MAISPPLSAAYFKLYRTTSGIVVEHYDDAGRILGPYLLPAVHTLPSIIEAHDVLGKLDEFWRYSGPDAEAHAAALIAGDSLLAPIEQQVVWAAGVTYETSKFARMAESEAAKDCYAWVYDPKHRPELFFKALPHQVAGPGRRIRMSSKSNWFVPEPEFVLVINSRGQIVGYSIGNDMSSRDIEGENPLYLPQAKVYDDGFGLGPCITVFRDGVLPRTTGLSLIVRRSGTEIFNGRTTLEKFNRTFDNLVEHLFEDRSFPNGVILSTGTCVVPSNETVVGDSAGAAANWTLAPGDELEITADRLGTLRNVVYRN